MKEIPKVLEYLGLNESQIAAYLFILDNKEANLKNIAKHTKLSSPGAIKMLKEMTNKGFIKKYKVKTKKVYLLEDIDVFQNEIIRKKKEEINDINQAFEEIKSSYGVYPIKITRIGADVLVDTMKSLIVKCKKVFEFVDRRYSIRNPDNKLNKVDIYKDVDFKTIYFDNEDSWPLGKRINLDKDKKYSYISSFEDKVSFTTTSKDTILIENVEIANTVQMLIDNVFENKSTIS